jgi:hypothetical protein
MKPIKTGNSNSILRAPEGDENVNDLPITRLEFPNGVQAVESCWEISEEELEIIKTTGKIYFLAVGDTHPPILLSAKSQLES